MQVVTDVDGSVMDSFTLHKPPGWQSKDAHRVESWDKSVLGIAGMSGQTNFSAQAALQGLQNAVTENVFGQGWIQRIVDYIRRHRSNMLHQILNRGHMV